MSRPTVRPAGVAATLAAVVSLAALIAAAPALAAVSPGALDPAFAGGSGVAANGSAQLLGVAVQPDGAVVAAGQSGGQVYVQRLTASGAPDGTYTGPPGAARAVAVEPDGDIVLAGTSGGAMLVERLTPSLAPDPNFGQDGIATAFAGQGGLANALALGPGGEIVAAGQVGSAPSTMAVAEFSAAGAPSGQEFAFGGNSAALGVAVEPSGNIAVVGRRNPGQAVDALIAILSPQGAQQNVQVYDYPTAGSTAFGAVTVASDGSLLVGGQANASSGPQTLFLRYSASGTLDPSFGQGGVQAIPASENLSTNPGGSVGAYGLAVAGGGAIIAAGPFEDSGAEVDAALWAVNAGGAPEQDFGNLNGDTELGPVSGSGSGGNYENCAVAIAPDGAPDAGEIVTVGDHPSVPDENPCASGGSAGGFVASYGGYGPPPPPPPFGSSGSAPQASTGPASSVSATAATLTGSVDPDGLATSYRFQYGTSSSYGEQTQSVSAGSGSAPVGAQASIGGLSPGTTYHYRIVASNADGTVTGSDMTFTTTAVSGGGQPPIAQTGPARGVGEVGATLTGSVQGEGLATTYSFQYGTTSSYGSQTAVQTLATGGTASVLARLGGLRPGTLYHYRLVASNAKGRSFGADRTLRTAPRLALRLLSAPRSLTLAQLARPGLAARLRASQPCRLAGVLVAPAALARRLHLGRGATVIARGGAVLRRAGIGRLLVRLLGADRRALSGKRGLRLTLRLSASPAGGGPTVSITRTITLEG